MKQLLLLILVTISLQSFATGIPLSTNFTVNTALPIEDRMSVADDTARNAIPSLRRWEGMLVYVIADQKHYVLIGGTADANWTVLSGGGGGGGNLIAWVTGHVYAVADTVIQSNKIYYCNTAHTSGTFATDLAAGKWTELSPTDLTSATGTLPITNGGTGSATQNFLDLTTVQTVAGVKTFTSAIIGSINGNAATVTTNAAMTGDVSSTGSTNVTTIGAGKIFNTMVAASAAIDFSKLGALSTGQAVIGNAGVPTATTISGGATIGATGVVTLGNTAVTGQALTGYTSGAGTISATDTILGAIQKLNGNFAAGPALTGAITTSGSVASLGSFTSAQLATALTDETGTLKTVFSDSPTFTTNLTAPLIIGGTGTTSTLIHRATSGVGATGADQIFQVGNNGATEAMRIQNNGNIGIGTASPNANTILDVASTTKAARPYPPMTATQKLAIASPAAGMIVFDTTAGQPSYYDGTNWQTGLGTITVDSDWIACTFSTLAWQGMGTITNALQCRRQGPNLQMRGFITLGTVVSSQAQLLLPNNWGNIVTASTTNKESYGTLIRNQAAPSVYSNAISSIGNGYFLASDDVIANAINPITPVNGGTPWGTGDTVTYSGISIPIQGWSSNASTFSAASAAIVSASYGIVTGVSTTSSTQINYNTVISDPLNLVTAGVGSWKFTAPMAGVYQISGIASLSGVANIVLYKNNNPDVYLTQVPASGLGTISGSVVLAKNDFIDVRPSATVTPSSSTAPNYLNWISITRATGGQTITATIAGYANAPGLAGSANQNIDHFSVSYGTTNSTTPCSSSPCSYLDQIGTAVSSITRSTTGQYMINTARTYVKLKCILNSIVPSTNPSTMGGADIIQCSNCSSKAFTTLTGISSAADTTGVIMCDGNY